MKYKNKEFNIEGYPSENFIEKVINVKPDQVTLVPDPPGALTSSFGWDCEKNKTFLTNIVKKFQNNNIRVSLFINPSIKTSNSSTFSSLLIKKFGTIFFSVMVSTV